MSFYDLKSAFKIYFAKKAKSSHAVQKIRVKERFNRALEQKSQKLSDKFFILFQKYTKKAFAGIAFMAVLISSGIIEAPFLPNQVAGKVNSLGGIVEIIRGDERFLVKGEVELFAGDSVVVGHKGKAQISSKHASSEMTEGSEIKINDSDDIFLKKGLLKSTNLKANEIKTERSLISNSLGSVVEVFVSETGETTIYSLEKSIKIEDNYKGKVEINKGEKIKISSDTVLVALPQIKDLKLSKTQLNSILGKLAITRTKLLKGLDLMVQGQKQEAFKSFRSAKTSYLSIVQVLNTDRELKLLVPQNTKIIELADISEMIEKKVQNIGILTESKALNIVFSILERRHFQVAFAPVETKSEDFNKFVLLQYLIGMTDKKEDQVLIQYLSENYVIASLQEIIRIQDKPLQEKTLRKILRKIPHNSYGKKYKAILKTMIPKDLIGII